MKGALAGLEHVSTAIDTLITHIGEIGTRSKDQLERITKAKEVADTSATKATRDSLVAHDLALALQKEASAQKHVLGSLDKLQRLLASLRRFSLPKNGYLPGNGPRTDGDVLHLKPVLPPIDSKSQK